MRAKTGIELCPNCVASYPFATTSPMFFSTLKQNGHSFSRKQLYEELRYVDGTGDAVHIGSDCWIGDRVFIGSGAKIIGNITIADDVVIGANAVVIHSITEPGITVAGNPAKKVSNTGSFYYLNKE